MRQIQWKSLRMILMIGLILAFAFTLIACNKNNQSTDSNPSDNQMPYKPVKHFNAPLTGEAIDFPLNDRPVIVMVENSPKARPQSGLIKADIVYEILAEGDITRFISIFQSDESAKAVGPVRSIRPYFAKLGGNLDGVIVHAGFSPDAIAYIKQNHLDHFDQIYGSAKYYWRDSSRRAPHNLYTTIKNIRQGIGDRNIRTSWTDPQFLFSDKDTELPVEIPFRKVTMTYFGSYNVAYEYDAQKRAFARYMNGQPHVDRESEKQIFAKNVLICFSAHQVLDRKGRRAVDVVGPNSGYLLQNGTYANVTWENKDGAIRAFHEGQEVALLPGKTWVQFLPLGNKLQWTN